jgi:peptide/nickel transport system ATP-binding protein
MTEPVLAVERLAVAFPAERGERHVLEDISFTIGRGEILGLVGESGSGKSVTSLSVMRLLPPNARITSGAIVLGGRDVTRLDPRAMLTIRGREAAMIFQEPMTSLNPLLRAGFQIGEVLENHLGLSRAEARSRTVDLMRAVGIPAPESRIDDYPHQLSGGMRQRVMIAMAMACEPKLLIADEPTTALDVSIQAQILALIRKLRDANDMGVLLITHDLGVVSTLADRVVVMYAGQVVEMAPVAALFRRPLHPYSDLLLKSVPRVAKKLARLHQIAGSPPSPDRFEPGCRFHPRCPLAVARCRDEAPALAAFEEGRMVRCWRAGEAVPGAAQEAVQA